MSDESKEPSDGAERETPDREQIRKQRFDVYVQWGRGKPHQHEETIRASNEETALMLAKRNIDIRLEPISLRVAARSATRTTRLGDPTIIPHTDRSYRNVPTYPTKEIDPPTTEDTKDDIVETEFTES